MKLKKLYHSVFAILTLCSCAGQYDIAGSSSLEEVDGHMLYLRVTGDGIERQVCSIDSCQVVHGRFRFGGNVDSVVLAQICVGNEAMMPVVIEDGALEIKIDPMGQLVEGGQLNKRLYAYLHKRDRLENELWEAEQDCIRMLRHGKNMEPKAYSRLKKRASRLDEEITEAETQFVIDNFDNALGPGYFIMLCNQQIFPVMTEQLQFIADKAPSSFFLNPFIRNYLLMAGYDFKSSRPTRSKR